MSGVCLEYRKFILQQQPEIQNYSLQFFFAVILLLLFSWSSNFLKRSVVKMLRVSKRENSRRYCRWRKERFDLNDLTMKSTHFFCIQDLMLPFSGLYGRILCINMYVILTPYVWLYAASMQIYFHFCFTVCCFFTQAHFFFFFFFTKMSFQINS